MNRFIKYTLVNGIILIINFFLYVVFIEAFHIQYIISNILAYAVSIILSFFLNKFIVFSQEKKEVEALFFFLMKFVMGTLSTIMLWALVDYKGLNKYIGSVTVTGFFFLLSYFFSKMIFMFQSKTNDLIELLRIRHWIKNILIFLPALCGAKFSEDKKYLYICVIVFVCMCFLSSAIYIMNDICDFENDIYNPRKQHHPLVAGRMTIVQAKKYFLICLILCCIFLYILYILLEFRIWSSMSIMAIIYMLINVGYSILKLKNIPVWELLILVLGYIIRLKIGGVVTETPISNYLLLTMTGGALYMVAEKRLSEKREYDRKQRNCIQKYSEAWLEKVMNLGLVFSMVFFSLWALEHFQAEQTVFLIIGALLIYLIYSFDIDRFTEGDPITIIYKDKVLLFLGIVYFGVFIIINI